jgi:phosphatidylserine/phosphatidylglycerophosphate/cardiolipin synthase-like enzyme
MGENHKTKIAFLLIGLFVGSVSGALAHGFGVSGVCPSKNCVDSSRIVPVTDSDYFDSAYNLIRSSSKSVYVMAFHMKYYVNYPESRQNRLVRELIYAKERGVDVKVIVDEYSTDNNAFDILSDNGVEITYDEPDRTTHTKLLIVDGEKVLVGSTNFSYFGLERNREANVLVEDAKTALYFTRYFLDAWEKNTN